MIGGRRLGPENIQPGARQSGPNSECLDEVILDDQAAPRRVDRGSSPFASCAKASAVRTALGWLGQEGKMEADDVGLRRGGRRAGP